ncbi:MAG: hypothetical protein AAF311_16650, partial [Pseudomonadota bacterium]
MATFEAQFGLEGLDLEDVQRLRAIAADGIPWPHELDEARFAEHAKPRRANEEAAGLVLEHLAKLQQENLALVFPSATKLDTPINVVSPHVAYKRFTPEGRFCVDLSNVEDQGWAPNDEFDREVAARVFGQYSDPDFLDAWRYFAAQGADVGWFWSKTDVKKGFTNLRLSYAAARVQAFEVGGFRVVPIAAHFGGSYQPYAFLVFSRLVQATARRLAPDGCAVVKTDDIITAGPSEEVANRTRKGAEHATLALFGPGRIHPLKTVEATQELEWLGWVLRSSRRLEISASAYKRRKLQYLLCVLIPEGALEAKRSALDVVCGFVQFLTLVILPARPLALFFQSMRRGKEANRNAVVRLCPSCRYALDGMRAFAAFEELLTRDARSAVDTERWYPEGATAAVETDASTSVGGGGLISGDP